MDELLDTIQELRQQNASLFSQLEAVKRVANDKQLEVDHCRTTCGELRDELAKAKAECERLRSLAVAAADLSIDVSQCGIDATKRIEELEAELKNICDAVILRHGPHHTLYKNALAALARAKAGV